MRKPRHRNSTRDRNVAELMTLRSLARELEAHVVALRHGDSPREDDESTWRGLSERQARLTRAAERTNRALVERAQANADWIQRLWELLCEKRRAADVSSFGRTAVLQWEATDKLVLEKLKLQVRTAARELPDVFMRHNIRLGEESVYCDEGSVPTERWTHTKADDLKSTLVCVRRLPFDIHSTSAALWKVLSHPESNFAYEDSRVEAHEQPLKARVVELTPTSCAIKYQERLELQREAALVDYHAVVQRASTAGIQDANVFVWQSVLSLADGTTHSDTMWTVVARCPGGGLKSVVALVCQSQLQATSEVNAASLQPSVMSAVETCIDNTLLNTESFLLGESTNAVQHPSDSSIQIIAV